MQTLEEALDLVKDKTCYVIGGQQVYEQTIRHADSLEITCIHQAYEGDSFFPEIDLSVWSAHKAETNETDSFITYVQQNND